VKKIKMNIQKLIVALLVMSIVIGLTGIAAANALTSYTDIKATYMTSSSSTTINGMTAAMTYSQLLTGELVYPTYPAYDLSWSNIALVGNNYAFVSEIESDVTGSDTALTIYNPGAVTGAASFWNCALWGYGEPPQTLELPVDINEACIDIVWSSDHPAGSAYPTESRESYLIYWP